MQLDSVTIFVQCTMSVIDISNSVYNMLCIKNYLKFIDYDIDNFNCDVASLY